MKQSCMDCKYSKYDKGFPLCYAFVKKAYIYGGNLKFKAYKLNAILDCSYFEPKWYKFPTRIKIFWNSLDDFKY